MSARPPLFLILAVLAVLIVIGAIASLMIGPAAIGGARALAAALFSGDGGSAALIMREVRLPRTLLSLTVGASLGLCGAALQGLLRNPLAEPGVIGISSAAALGAVIALYTGLSAAFALALPLAGMAGAFVCVLLLQGLAGRAGMLTLILAGVAITSLCGALTALALNLSPNPFAALEIVFWMMGSFANRSMQHVWLALPFMLAGWAVIGAHAGALNALSLGEETAASLGVDLGRTRLAMIAGTALAVGAATAVSGVIGFVGLVVPHLLRPLVGHHPARLLPASALGGAVILVFADILVRLVTPGTELRIGVVTALIGAPFFLWLVMRARGGERP